MDLRDRRCIPCDGTTAPLDASAVRALAARLPGWTVRDDRLVRRFAFRDFASAMAFVNRMAAVAEAEDHHPDFCVHYRQVDVSIWTHAVGGLTENDFILAAKIEVL